MRVLFIGSGEFGLPTLRHLRQRHQVLAVISQPDRPAGRKLQATPTPVAAWSRGEGLPTWTHADVNEPEFVAQVGNLGAEAAVVIAFGQKLSPAFVAAGGRLMVNLHASLLPRHRGAAPINWAILSGDAITGVSVISIAPRMDAGLVYATASTPIDPRETAGELHDRLALLGPDVIEEVLAALAAGRLRGVPQDERLATRAGKLSAADRVLRFDQAAEMVRRRVHGLTPWPGVLVQWVRASDGRRQPLMLRRVAVEDGSAGAASPGQFVDATRVATAEGLIRLLEVQKPGGRTMSLEEFVRGHAIAAGDRLEPAVAAEGQGG